MKKTNFIKKILCGSLTLAMTFSVVACSKTEISDVVEGYTAPESQEEPVEEQKPATWYDSLNYAPASDDNYRNYYEVFVYSFCDSDGDGIGDLNGVTSKLDYIAGLGCNGIWLMPVCESTTYHKYDIIDYCSIDSEYGTMEDFEVLIDEAHKRGINVIIDMVLNHSSSEHEWFQAAEKYLCSLPEGETPNLDECPYVDYYHFTTENPGSGYTKLPGVNWYYESVFWSEMPDLNLSSEALQGEIQNIVDFWIGKGVDGFRLDAVAHFEENDVAYNNEVLSRLYEYCTSLDPDFYLVSEAWEDLGTITSYYGSGTPSFFNFDAAGAEGKLLKVGSGSSYISKLLNAMISYQEAFSEKNPDYIDAIFLTNHDQPRVSNGLNADPDAMKMSAGLMMTMSGNVFIYYGEEIGMRSKGTADENKRLPMVWSKTDEEGMTKGPIDAEKGIESSFDGADLQSFDEDSILSYYRRALLMRNAYPEIARGTVETYEELTSDYQALITKTYDDNRIAIVYNTAKENATLDLTGSEFENWQIDTWLTLHPEEEVKGENGVIDMPARSIAILIYTVE